MNVIGADGAVGGIVRDVWVDRSEVLIRYLEVEVPAAGGARRVLLPSTSRGSATADEVVVNAILGAQFADVPALRSRTA